MRKKNADSCIFHLVHVGPNDGTVWGSPSQGTHTTHSNPHTPTVWARSVLNLKIQYFEKSTQIRTYNPLTIQSNFNFNFKHIESNTVGQSVTQRLGDLYNFKTGSFMFYGLKNRRWFSLQSPLSFPCVTPNNGWPTNLREWAGQVMWGKTV